MRPIAALFLASLCATACGGAHPSLTADVIGDGQAPVDSNRVLWLNGTFSPALVHTLQQAPGGFDPSQHCLQLVYKDGQDNIWDYVTVELSASGPCPATGTVPKDEVVASFGWDSLYFLTPVGQRGPGERLGQFSGQVETSQSKAELTNLCFGQSDWPDIYDYRDDYAKACDVVLRHQRVCEVVLRGESPQKDCK